MDTKTIILRKIPTDLHRRVKVQAVLQNMSMQDWVISALRIAVVAGEGKVVRESRENA